MSYPLVFVIGILNHTPFNIGSKSIQIADFALTLRGGQIDVDFSVKS